MQARYYDPVIGRFYSNDPVGYVTSNVHSFGRYTYANNNPYKYIDPDGKWGVLGAIYGAISGAMGGFVSSSGGSTMDRVIGTVSGAIAGGAVGFVAPQTSNAVGLAVAGGLASAGGQATGSAMTAAMKKGIANVTREDIKVSPVTTALGAVGAGGGGLVGQGVAQSTMRPIVGQSLTKAGGQTTAGVGAGAIVEGTIIGTMERGSSLVGSAIEKATPIVTDAYTSASSAISNAVNKLEEKLN